MKKIQRFLWWCAGANIQILEQYPTEWGKYFGIGGTIVFTALMASFAGGYAFFTAFKDAWLATAFGIFWGALIFNLDRYIVSSIGKGDGTSKITWDEFMNSFPRIILAILIGFVIAVPLEIKVFEREIKAEIQEIVNEKRQKMMTGLNDLRIEQQRLKDRIAELKGQEKTLGQEMQGEDPRIILSNQKISALAQQQNQARKDLSKVESDQRRLATDVAILDNRPNQNDKIAKLYQKKQILDKKEASLRQQIQQIGSEKNRLEGEKGKVQTTLSQDLNVLKEQNKNATETLNRQIADIDTIIQRKVREIEAKANQYDGFMAQLEGLDRLCVRSDTVFGYPLSPSSATKNTDSVNNQTEISAAVPIIKSISEHKTVVFYAKWMLTLLLIAIEITPILFKMMTESGPYDDRIEEIRYESDVKKKKFISDVNQQINTELQLGQSLTQQKLKSELEANEALLNAIAKAQSDVIMVAIEQWKKREMERAMVTPEEFVVASNGSAAGSVFEGVEVK